MTNITNVTGKYEQAFHNETADKQGINSPAKTTEAVETERPQDDRVSLSNASREMQAAKDAVAASPDVRQDKVDALKEAVESDNYKIDPGQIAEKMIGSIINEVI
jgi:negative regulator of flagellin synthesis FlgM